MRGAKFANLEGILGQYNCFTKINTERELQTFNRQTGLFFLHDGMVVLWKHERKDALPHLVIIIVLTSLKEPTIPLVIENVM